MAAVEDEAVEALKSCCTKWKEKLSTSEHGRLTLRKGIKILERAMEDLQKKFRSLQKDYEAAKSEAQLERELKENEVSQRLKLQEELCHLKEELSALKQANTCSAKSLMLEDDSELKRLRDLLDEQRKKLEVEKKKAEAARNQVKAEKKKAADVMKQVQMEKGKVEEGKNQADLEKKKAEQYRREADREKVNAASERKKAEEAKRLAEVEKKRADNEKQRADSEMRKAEEHMKLVEEERRKVLHEKNHAHHLSEKLEEAQKRKAAEGKLQRFIPKGMGIGKFSHVEAQENSSVPCDDKGWNRSMQKKLLKQQLKLEKKQLRLAERMANEERKQKTLLQQEILLLKQNCIHNVHHLSFIESRLAYDIEDTNVSATEANAQQTPSHNKGKSSIGRDYKSCHSGKKLCPPQWENLDHLNCSKPTIENAGSLLPFSVGSSTSPISGINSELESPIGGSFRNKSQSSAIFSTTTSFSDREFVGSQERCACSMINSSQLAKTTSRQDHVSSKLSGEVTGLGHQENLGESVELGKPFVSANHPVNLVSTALTSLPEGNIKLSQSDKGRRREKKTMRAHELEGSMADSKPRLPLKMEKHQSSLEGIPNYGNHRPLPLASLGDGKTSKRRRELVSVPLVSGNEKADRSHKKMKVTEKQSPAPCFENIISTDVMKLLALDNEADEKYFQAAMESPLSPTLPEIPCHYITESAVDGTDNFVEQVIFKMLETEKDNLFLPETSDVVDTEIDTNRKGNHEVLGVSEFCNFGEPMQSIEEATANFNLPDIGGSLSKSGESNDRILESELKMTVSTCMPISSSSSEKARDFFLNSKENTLIGTPKHCVLFPNIKDERSISRIYFAMETCISQNAKICWKDWIVEELVVALSCQIDLSAEEKACVFFSLLLYNYSIIRWGNSGSSASEEPSLYLDSLKIQMHKVFIEMESRSVLFKPCEFDILLSLIGNFLIDGTLLEMSNSPREPFLRCTSSASGTNLNGRNISISSGTATISQLIAAVTILGSICVAIGYVAFLYEASYNILRSCKKNSFWILTVLHAFASLCGTEYFVQKDHNLFIVVVKSIVSALEKKDKLDGSLSLSCVLPNDDERFLPCQVCPFAEGATCLDTVTQLLLEKIRDCSIMETQHPQESSIFSDCLLSSFAESMGRSSNHVNICGCDSIEMHANAPHCVGRDILKDVTSMDCRSIGLTLCSFGGYIALVELIAYYMGWQRTCNEILPHLWRMLEASSSEDYSVAILTLVGQLGRLGVDAHGSEESTISQLRCKLSEYLNLQTSQKGSFFTQFAAAEALVNILPLKFEECVHGNCELMVGLDLLSPLKSLREWFFQVSEDQRALLLHHFRECADH
ncbi:uncharacterized protein LOC18443047 isoform X1 [Amborella trichopoda]|uniref:Uncharacterized protein n=1 Tax=Amborella trichopoda TaxID=13333 RepID=U5D340_AMBTC|nr:uncharacterized protein LOC18443047 isoform X1 [Amborella trichopoda]XP_020528418.1 uncharacterized protein LOC18443047 isoform X1 [Amborella trichopoda]XP_020528419.1 uncharacterized protein LOC18443047 isoform X1 [Amborella trichopoda]XP_020528420.1 uncharacterized protein LOC18443047 isoform X1 [Amborella trichopoda]XP_020528421.1 uncharacterized protein LOC18443047 isoform X1 [Amborella trichopoda]ERN14778.1 hypothetical protein AMTR_s00032p00046150 [Amborella trichopoda]|eukprot:XP_006853311.1 uncharacterized protein LOC18443047 isoform X1 [Amborella trichopoda]